MYSWLPHCDHGVCKQDPSILDSDISEDNFRGEDEEALGQKNGTPSKGAATVKGEPKTVRATQH